MHCLTAGPPALCIPRAGTSWQAKRARPLSGNSLSEGMARVHASNERWVRNRQHLELEFRRIERESAKREASDRLLEHLGDLVAQMLCPEYGGAGQYEKRNEDDRSESKT
jgi:hypothetical protein